MAVATTPRSQVLHLSLVLGGQLRDADGLRLGRVDDLIVAPGAITIRKSPLDLQPFTRRPHAEELRAKRLSDEAARRTSAGFQALAAPTRLTIAFALRDASELCVCDLAWIVERAQNLVSHHLRALRTGGLVDYRREGKMALYSLTERGQVLLELIGVEMAARG